MNKRTYKNQISVFKALIGLVLMLSFAVQFCLSDTFAKTNDYSGITNSSQINVEFKNGISTSLEVRAILPKDLTVSYTVNNVTTETTDFTLEDDIVAPLKGDFTITVKLGNVTKVVVAALDITNDENVSQYINSKLETGDISLSLNVSSQTADASTNTNASASSDASTNSNASTSSSSTSTSNLESYNLTLNTDSASLIKYALTDSELTRVLEGTKLTIALEIDISDTETNRLTKGGQAIEALLSTSNKAHYFKVSLYKIFDDDYENKILVTELDSPVSFTFSIPESLMKKAKSFSLVASHTLEDGTIETFELKDMDEDENTYTISTSKFCTMAFVYEQRQEIAANEDLTPSTTTNEVTYNTPQTSDFGYIFVMIIMGIAVALMLAIFVRKELKN